MAIALWRSKQQIREGMGNRPSGELSCKQASGCRRDANRDDLRFSDEEAD